MPEKNDLEIAEQKRKAALADKGTPNAQRMIAALLRERSALESQGNSDRVKQVDAQLAHYGYESPKGEEPPKAPADDPKKQAPQGRSANPPKQTKD